MTKNPLHLLLFIVSYVLIATSASAQSNFTRLQIGSVISSTGATVCVPVQAQHVQQLTSLQFSIRYESDRLEFLEIQPQTALPTLSTSNFNTQLDGQILFSWEDQTIMGLDLPEGAVIFEMCFNVLTSTALATPIYFVGSAEGQATTPAEVGIISAEGNLENGPLALTGGQIRLDGQAPLEIADLNIATEECEILSNYQLQVMLSGGQPPYQFIWREDGPISTIGSSQISTYASVVEFIGQDVDDTQVRVLIEFPAISTSDLPPVDIVHVDCGTQTLGAIVFDDPEGVYAYTWGDGSTGNALTDLTAGTYQVTIADPVTGCVQDFAYQVGQENLSAVVLSTCVGTQVQLEAFLFPPEPFTMTVIGEGVNHEEFYLEDAVLEVPEGEYEVTITTVFGCSQTYINWTPECSEFDPEITLAVPELTTVAPGESFCVPVTASQFDEVVSAQMSIGFDPNVVELVGVETEIAQFAGVELYSSIEIANELGEVRFIWIENNAGSLTLPNSSTLFELCFQTVGAAGTTSVLEFRDHPLPPEIHHVDEFPYSINTEPGTVLIEGGVLDNWAALSVGDAVVFPGDEVSIPVLVGHLENVISAQFTMNWNPSVLQLDTVWLNDNWDALTLSNFGFQQVNNGLLTFAWASSTGTGISIAPESTVFLLRFTAIGEDDTHTTVGFTSTPTPIEFYLEGATEEALFGSNAGSVTIDADDFVFPGDANADRTANHFDLLPLGMGFGQNGPQRPHLNLEWNPQPAIDWGITTPGSQLDLKHADTDGSGLLDAADTIAISNNWGEVVEFFGSAPAESLLADGGQRSSNASFLVLPDTVEAGSTVRLPIILGEVNSVTDLYGVAFSILYDPEVIVPNTARVDFLESWLGQLGVEILAIQRDAHEKGRIDVAVTRLNQQGNSGMGVFGHLNITIEDVIFRRNEVPLVLEIENVVAISPIEETILLNPRSSTGVIVDELSAAADPEFDDLRIFPNPVREVLHIQWGANQPQRFQVFDAYGKLVYNGPADDQLNVEGLAAGTYELRIVGRRGTGSYRFIKR